MGPDRKIVVALALSLLASTLSGARLAEAKPNKAINTGKTIVLRATGSLQQRYRVGMRIDRAPVRLQKDDHFDVLVDGRTQQFVGPGIFTPGESPKPTPNTPLLGGNSAANPAIGAITDSGPDAHRFGQEQAPAAAAAAPSIGEPFNADAPEHAKREYQAEQMRAEQQEKAEKRIEKAF